MALNALLQRQEPSWIQQFTAAPHTTLSKTLYARRRQLLGRGHNCSRSPLSITVVCVSDTHNTKPFLPHGDILIHAGDLTQNGTAEELQDQLDWLNTQPHEHKIVIAGNHDSVLSSTRTTENTLVPRTQQSVRWGSIIYLEDSSTAVALKNSRRLTLYGNPYTQKHGNWAFQYDKGVDVFSGQVPESTDILITHSPPKFHLDVAGWGDMNLLRELWRTRPRLHIFGHIHAGAGQDVLVYDLFERLYERVSSGDAGVIALIQMALLLLLMHVGATRNSASKTILVNASVVGGLLDQRWREIQVVSL